MYKFTERDIDWEIILDKVSEQQLSVFADKDTEYRKYNNTSFSEALLKDLNKWADILNKIICLDLEVVNVVARYLSNLHKTNYRKVRIALIKKYNDTLEMYKEYLESFYGAKDYLSLSNANEATDINEALNSLMLLDTDNRDYQITNYIEDKCIDGDIHTLINIITINKINNLQ